MTVDCEAIEVGFNCPASESNQGVDDSSAKTIEFLRARLLAERAASKSARQQAQDISEKVKELHTCLEREIELRKEAEAAMEKVFTALKAKGVALDGITLPVPTDTQAQSEEGASPLDIVEETKEAPSQTVDISNQKGVSCPIITRNEAVQKGIIVECTKVAASELHIMDSAVDTRSNSDVPSINLMERKGGYAPSMDFAAENQQYVIDQVQDVIKEVVHPDHDKPDCTPVIRVDVGAGQSLQHGLSITSKLKAMLQQIEEEVGALPEEQPLRAKLQGWVGQAANMLDRGLEAAVSGGLETVISSGCPQPDFNCSSETIAAVEAKDIGHTKVPVQSKYAEAFHLDECGVQPAKLMHGIAGAKTCASPLPHAQLHQRQPTFHTPMPTTAGKDTPVRSSMSHQRKPGCEAQRRGTTAPYVSRDSLIRDPWPSQMSQYDNSHSGVACRSMIPCGLISTGKHVGSESSYLVEVPSPRSSDVLSVGDDKMGYAKGQHDEFWSPTSASALQGQNAWSPAGIGGENAWCSARIGGQPRAMLSNGCFVADPCSYTHLGAEEHSFHRCKHRHQARDIRNYSQGGVRLLPKDLFPCQDAALSVVDERGGRLGGILMALDAARQHIQDDELMGPSTPTRADPRLRRGYRYGDRAQQLASSSSSEFLNDSWKPPARSSYTNTPIIQFPPSPTSDYGYSSPFEWPRGTAHRRSSSVSSTSFMMSGWDNYLQRPRGGELELGNGITLYTD